MRKAVFFGFWREKGEPQMRPGTRVNAYERCKEDKQLWELQAVARRPGHCPRPATGFAGQRFLASTATRCGAQRLFLFFQAAFLGHRQTTEASTCSGRGQTPAWRS